VFEEATEKALQGLEDSPKSDSIETKPSEGTEVSNPEEGNHKAEAEGIESEAKQDNQAILDLAKVQKFKLNGQEMTFDELQKSILRQQDYTKKTQALAEERKFIDNLDADLLAVKKNPTLASKFKEVYPERFHRYLDVILERQAEAEARGEEPSQKAQIPDEIRKRIEQHEEAIRAFQEEKTQAQTEALENLYESVSQEAVKKYPRADLVHVYGALEQYITQNNITAKQLLTQREATQKLFDHFAKASHDSMMKAFQDWQKSELEKARKINAQAGDVARGGGTPSAPPVKMKLRDVAEAMIADLNQ